MSLFAFKLTPPKQDDLVTEDSEDAFSQVEFGEPTRFQTLCYLLFGMSHLIMWVNLPKGGASRRSRVQAWGLFWFWMTRAYPYVASQFLSWAAPSQIWGTARWTPYGDPPKWVWVDWAFLGTFAWFFLVFAALGHWGMAAHMAATAYLCAGVLPRGLRLGDSWAAKRILKAKEPQK